MDSSAVVEGSEATTVATETEADEEEAETRARPSQCRDERRWSPRNALV